MLIDPDIFIDHLRGRTSWRPGRRRLLYSVITRTELLADNSAIERTHLLPAAVPGDRRGSGNCRAGRLHPQRIRGSAA